MARRTRDDAALKRGEALVRSLGADDIIDYTTEDDSRRGRVFDAGFDLVGGQTCLRMLDILKPGRTLVSVAATPEPQTALRDLGNRKALAGLFWAISFGLRQNARCAGVRYRYLFMHPSGRDLAQLAALIEAGRLRVMVDKTFPFAQIAEALTYVEEGCAKGKVVVVRSV